MRFAAWVFCALQLTLYFELRAALCNNPLKIVTSTRSFFGVSVGLMASSQITPISNLPTR
jgi:hypothetical protein